MSENNHIQTQLTMTDYQQNDSEIELTIVVKVKLPKPSQSPQLPNQLERGVEIAGQQFKRDVYKWLIERADQELVEREERSKKFIRHGNIPYSFKTVFGKVAVNRIRLKYPNNETEIVSVSTWKTPQKMCITRGLREVACDLVVKTSINNAQKGISQRSGERDLLSTRTVLNILHGEGEAIIKAQQERAHKVYEEIPEAKSLIIDSSKPWRKRLPVLNDELWDTDYQYDDLVGAKVIWYWENDQITIKRPQRTEAEGLVTIQCDECIVKSQSKIAGKDVWVFTAVVNADGRAYYFTGESAAKLFYQIGALLAVLDVHKGYRDILVLGDGARWIRKWYRELPLSGKSQILCWYHLTQTCHDLLTAGFGYARGLALEAGCFRHLWRGEVMAAVNAIEDREKEVINRPKYRRLIRYLKARLPMIPNYKMRRSQGQWIANTRVEAFNNWSVASRCKGQGRTWGTAGVRAVAALVAAERNGELETWWQCGELPAWNITSSPTNLVTEIVPAQDYPGLDYQF